VSDSVGRMSHIRLDMFIQELLILPAAVFESPSFEYSEGIARTLFDQVSCLPYRQGDELVTSAETILSRLGSVSVVVWCVYMTKILKRQSRGTYL